MQDADVVWISISLVGVLLSGILFYVAHIGTHEKIFFRICASIVLLMPILIIAGVVLNSDKLSAFGLVEPISFFLLLLAIRFVVVMRKSYVEINAQCTGYQEYTRKFITRYIPEFSYRYNGKDYQVYSYMNYDKRKFQRLFKTNETYTIYINPEAPHQCVYRRVVSGDMVLMFIFSIFFILLGIFIMLVG